MSWALKAKLQRILAQEKGAAVVAPGAKDGFALVYPNTYNVGMSNLGFQIIYQQINTREDTACERFFLPDAKTEAEYIRTNTPLLSIETQRPLYGFSLIGFAASFEMDYFNMLKILSLGKVPLLAADRSDHDPLVIMGGPCATFNPEPVAEFVDLCIIGEGEEVIQEVIDEYYRAKAEELPRGEILKRLAKIDGIYVPSFYEHIYDAQGMLKEIRNRHPAPARVRRRWVKDLACFPGQTVIYTEDSEFRGMFLIEVARGCGRHCRFCMAGYCFRMPRSRPLNQVKTAVDEAKKYCSRVGLVGAAVSDYPDIDDLCDYVLAQGMSLSVASLRADSLSGDLVKALVQSGHKTITLAPEAASDKLRKVINKGITDEDLARSVEMAVREGIPNVRLYIMVGLPFEETEDIVAIAEMAKTVKRQMEELGSRGRLTLSINPFIPKPFTPFQWEPMADYSTVEERLKFIQGALKNQKGIEILVEPPREAYIQGVLSRGDRRLAKVLLAAFYRGGVKGWKQALKEYGVDPALYLYRQRDPSEILPWSVLDMGLEANYLTEEMKKAAKLQFTARCVSGCKRCGVCSPDL